MTSQARPPGAHALDLPCIAIVVGTPAGLPKHTANAHLVHTVHSSTTWEYV